ncbi:Tubby-like F-box protein 11 [Zea mays]|uniref:Tubby-like F-box protein 11 n=1 Tax=Zea mays TaxID=4577 RepID=A0A3L6EVP0_MAIZE|nr:Tubby-like F-box protein 11 [Zea mays]
MPFSSMIQEMKGEIGAISSRGVLRFRPGGHAEAGRASAAELDEAPREGCWAQLPLDLLRMVLVRVEDQEPRWLARSAVVACACVCRCWTATIKEIVRVPEASRKLTFPISLKQVVLVPSHQL